jgi:hypothetical protein
MNHKTFLGLARLVNIITLFFSFFKWFVISLKKHAASLRFFDDLKNVCGRGRQTVSETAGIHPSAHPK